MLVTGVQTCALPISDIRESAQELERAMMESLDGDWTVLFNEEPENTLPELPLPPRLPDDPEDTEGLEEILRLSASEAGILVFDDWA